MKMRIQKAFTLVELLVVIAIIGILAAAVIFGVSNARQKGAQARAMSDCTNYITAQQATYAETGSFITPGDTACGGGIADPCCTVGSYVTNLYAPNGWSYSCVNNADASCGASQPCFKATGTGGMTVTGKTSGCTAS